MLRRKFGQLLASGLALMGLGRSTAKRRGGQLSILFSHGKFSRECVWADVTGSPDDVAEFYDLWQESMWPGYKNDPQYHQYRKRHHYVSDGIRDGELGFALGNDYCDKAFKDAMEGYSGTFFTTENAAKYVLSL